MLQNYQRLLTFLSLIVFGLLLRFWVITPVDKLTILSIAVANGDFSNRLKLKKGKFTGEFDTLSSTINFMLDSIEEQIKEIKEKELYLQNLIDAIPDAVRIIDEDYNITLSNKTYNEQIKQKVFFKSDKCYGSYCNNASAPCNNSQYICPLKELKKSKFTGIIVDFRTKDVLRDNREEGSYPLFYSHHIKNGRVSWPVGREAEYIVTDRSAYLQKNTDYLFVKRFTSKEEKRRLQCGIYLKNDHSQYKYISTQNKINYIKCDAPELAYGLFVILNSSLYDAYYRILNGSTQVNSTEINCMPVPSKESIRQMGRELIGMELTETNCDKIIDRWIK